MADTSMDMTAIQIVNDQLATMEATMEEITSPTKVRIDTEEQIVNPWAVSAGNDDPERTFQERVTQPTGEWLGQAWGGIQGALDDPTRNPFFVALQFFFALQFLLRCSFCCAAVLLF